MNTFLQRATTATYRKVILFGFGLLLFLNTLPNAYNVDDTLVTMGHPLTSKGFAGIPEIFSSPYYQDDMGYRYEYRPVTLTSFAIEHQLLGESAKTSHLINALLFALTCLLVGDLAVLLSPSGWTLFPLLAGLLFAAHPMHVEAVASIKNRDEMLALLFALGSFHQAFRFSKGTGYHTIISASLLMLLSLLSKTSAIPMVMVIPAALIALRTPWQKVVAIGMALFVSLGIFMLLGDWPLERLIIVAAMLVATTATGLIFSNIHWLRTAAETFKKAGLPGPDQKWDESPRELMRTGWPIHLLVGALVALAVYQGDIRLLSLPIAVLSFRVWLTRKLRFDTLLLFVLATMASAFVHQMDACLYASFGVILAVGHYSSMPPRLMWALLIPIMFTHSVSNMVLGETFSINEGPYLPMLASILLRRFGRRVVHASFAISAGVQIVATFFSLTYLNLAISVFIPLTWYISSLEATRPNIRPILVAALLLFATLVIAISSPLEPQELLRSSAFSHAEHETETSQPAPAPTISPQKERPTRPLTYIEFPLGQDADWDHRIGTASVLLGHYLKMMFIAYPQAFYYGFDEVHIVRSSHPWAIFSIILHMSLLLLALLLARNHPVLSIGIIAYLACIFLFSNLVSPVAGMIGDRLTYVASFGFCLAMAYSIQWAYERWQGGRRVISGATIALLLFWSGMTLARNTDWKDRVTLMEKDLEHVPRSAQAHYLLGFALMEKAAQQRDPSAMRELQKQGLQHLKTAPSIYPGYLNYWYDLGRAYRDMGDLRSALPCYKEAHRLDSTYVDAIMQVAMLSEELNDPANAQFYYERCIRINPRHLQAYTNLSFLLFKAGQLQESIAVNEKAIAVNASWRDPYDNIARTYQVMQQPEMAQKYLDRLKNLR
jgi:tetratricopeptide (TPR) repeat protein